MENKQLIEKLKNSGMLEHGEWLQLVSTFSEGDRIFAADMAQKIAIDRFGKTIFFRGIVEFTNICRCDCRYCGIRRSNARVSRYRLTEDEILECCAEGYSFGYRTFVLQGGEDLYWNDEKMSALVRRIRREYPDCAITLSIGERSRESYQLLFDAGADRYLLRHETANREHYGKMHPVAQSFDNRMRCLRDLKEIGYQTGCGMMVGSPYQTNEIIAQDMQFLCDFRPQMVGMGPFIPHQDTPFRDFPAGSVNMTLFLLSLVRIAMPDVLLPSTTALGTVQGNGRQLGVLAGCNVVMPNLSPMSVRKKYLLYDNKVGTDSDAESSIRILRKQMEEIGYEVVTGRGDYQERR
jgi:biotin synthase